MDSSERRRHLTAMTARRLTVALLVDHVPETHECISGRAPIESSTFNVHVQPPSLKTNH